MNFIVSIHHLLNNCDLNLTEVEYLKSLNMYKRLIEVAAFIFSSEKSDLIFVLLQITSFNVSRFSYGFLRHV